MDADEEIPRRRQPRALAVLLVMCALVVCAAVALFLMLNGGDEDQASAPASGPAVSSPASEPDVSPPSVTPRGKARGKPDTVLLPRGGEAKLVREKIADDGSLRIPSNLGEAAWWGAGIGSHGAMVLSGHINWNGAIGPFQELWRTRRGDVVTVVDGDGRKFKYRVSEVITLDKDELPQQAGELFGQSGPNRLVLVTGGGRWLGGSQGYEDNRIVVAVPA